MRAASPLKMQQHVLQLAFHSHLVTLTPNGKRTCACTVDSGAGCATFRLLTPCSSQTSNDLVQPADSKQQQQNSLHAFDKHGRYLNAAPGTSCCSLAAMHS